MLAQAINNTIDTAACNASSPVLTSRKMCVESATTRTPRFSFERGCSRASCSAIVDRSASLCATVTDGASRPKTRSGCVSRSFGSSCRIEDQRHPDIEPAAGVDVRPLSDEPEVCRQHPDHHMRLSLRRWRGR